MEVRREWLEHDYYAELGVASTASADEITKAYRSLARRLHPDASPGDAAAEERFKRVTTAYEVLSDTDKRAQYDEVRRYGAGPSGPHTGPGVRFDVDDEGLEDLLGGMFGGQGPFSRGPRSGGGLFGRQPGRGVDQRARLPLGFDDAVRGLTTSVTVGHAGDTRDIKVRIPAGVSDGQQLRLRGKGGHGRNGGPPGDLLVTVDVARHPVFGRDGKHLTVTVPISFPDAVFGTTISVPTMDDEPVTLRIPPGTKSGRRFRVKGQGVPTAVAGDLLVTVEVDVPTALTDDQAQALRAYAEIADPAPGAGKETD